jgi:hypothetical protein
MEFICDVKGTALALWEELGGLADPALLHNSTTPHLLLRMTEVKSRLYATTSLGLDGGDVQVFLDFLEDERDKRSGMIEASNDYRGAGSSNIPWQHLPLPPSFPGQPRSSLAAAAVAMAQEWEAQLWPNPIQDAAMEVDRDQGLGTTIGTSSGPQPEGKLSKSPPGFLLQAVKVCLPGCQVGDGVKIVISNDNQEYHAPQVMTPLPLMVSPLSVAPPVDVRLPASTSSQPGKSNIMPWVLLPPAPGSSILHAPAQPRHIPLNTKALEAIQTPSA